MAVRLRACNDIQYTFMNNGSLLWLEALTRQLANQINWIPVVKTLKLPAQWMYTYEDKQKETCLWFITKVMFVHSHKGAVKQKQDSVWEVDEKA